MTRLGDNLIDRFNYLKVKNCNGLLRTNEIIEFFKLATMIRNMEMIDTEVLHFSGK